jgi:hypothetical protein
MGSIIVFTPKGIAEYMGGLDKADTAPFDIQLVLVIVPYAVWYRARIGGWKEYASQRPLGATPYMMAGCVSKVFF